jgi:hypothetical protein
VAMSFSWRLIHPIKDRVHLAYKYWGSQTLLAWPTARSPGMRCWPESPNSTPGGFATRGARRHTP